MKYRSREDIAAAILEITKEGVRKSKIMYRAYLSYPQLREYLDVLLDADLIRYDGGDKRMYRITEKGLRFSNMYNEVDGIIPRTNMLTKKMR